MSDLLELSGLAEIAEICETTKPTALRYTKRADFPDPIGRIAAGPIWRRADIERWAASTLPLQVGRPRQARLPT
jgi:hypothetical protein